MRFRWFVTSLLALSIVAVPAGAQELPPGGTFVDDDESVHEGMIEAIAAAGITRSCNPPIGDRFCPDDPVTRGQMAAFLVRALDLSPGSGDTFTDDDSSEFEADIEALAAAGITTGCDDERFCPDQSITRGQMAAFLVRAYEYPAEDEDRFVDDDGSIFEDDIDALAAAGITKGCTETRFCPDDPVTRAQMASFIGRAEELSPIVPPDRVTIALEEVATGLDGPVYITAPAGDDRVFIVEKSGVISILGGDGPSATPFLDISDEVSEAGSEMGLLSMAFHPDYADNGRFFVYYSTSGGSQNHLSRVAEYRVSGDPDVASGAETEILTISQPNSNHNGGHLLFGPDGYLYVGLGDGGGGGDPGENGQDPATLLGSILRLDVDGGDPYAVPADNPYVGEPGADEIWAIGVRNPWRMWFDGDLLYVADVGQGSWEEVTVLPVDEPGANLGWDVLEGTHCHEPSSGCSSAGTVLPIIEHSHATFCSITGGVVYRGDEIPQLQGRYLYVDLCEGIVRTLVTDGDGVLERDDLGDELGFLGGVWSFGVDGAGEVYIAQGNGTVSRLVGR